MSDETSNSSPSRELMARLVELEVKVAFQERTIDDLDAVIRGYADRLEQLERELEALRRSLPSLREPGPADEKPPHY